MPALPPNRLMVWLYRHGLGRVIGKMILLLTTTGRKTGLKRITPLQYEKIGDAYFLGSAKGSRADWVKNLMNDQSVQIQVGSRRFLGSGQLIDDPEKIADFLEYRLKRHPVMIGLILKTEGISPKPGRGGLLRYAQKLVLVRVDPAKTDEP
jgi:deazaflavin-dependent oxidoreductase (nitroreductase family)